MNQRIIATVMAGMLTTMALSAKEYRGNIISTADGEPLTGATVMVKGTNIGTTADIEGNWVLDIPASAKYVTFTFVGMQPLDVPVKDLNPNWNDIKLDEVKNQLNEVVVTGMGTRKKITVTGAVTNVDVTDMKHFASSNLSNALAGNVPGIMAMQTSGQPGKNKSEFWIRGISTFGASKSAYILVDGFERENIDDLNIEDIETFTVLKDASATAIYGSKGANGVVLITTKHGRDGKINVNVKFETSYNTRTKTPEFVDGVTYAQLLNEANITRAKGEYFTPTEIELFRTGLDPDLYPNVDWKNLILRDGAMSYRANANISGGGPRARYYASMSYVTDQGMYKTDDAIKDKYNTNANYNRWNYRVNLDITATPTTIIKIGTSGDLSTRNAPGQGDVDLWNSLFGYNAILTPVLYSNGYVPMINIGRDNARTNPWVMTTQTGYLTEWNNNLQNNISLEQKLDFITRGLNFTGRVGYDTYNYSQIKHIQEPDRWYANGRDKQTGEIIFDKIKDMSPMTQSSNNNGSRRFFVDLLLNYNRDFGKNNVGANLKYTYDSFTTTQNIGDDIKNSVAKKNMSVAGQLLYNFDYRYFADVNFGYNGSENFADGHRWGFFPAFSLGWNLSRESFMRWASESFLNMFKIRYSWGKVGNDAMSTRFPYLYTIDYSGDNVYNFGTQNSPTQSSWQHGLHYTALASNNVTWEVSKKQDVGLDIALFNNHFSLTVDYFHEKRTGIYMLRNFLPGSLGLESSPWANVGSVKSEGFDGNFRYENRFGEFNWTLRGNFTYSKNTILNYDVENVTYPYQLHTGYRVGQIYGLVAEGLFADYDDIRNHPKQMFGEVMPGDIKYKDVNGDAVINDDDQVAIGATDHPNLIYGFGTSLQWRGFDVNVLFQGAGKQTVMLNGKSVYAFSADRYGQIFGDLVKDRWVDTETAAQLGIPANENPNATYPRLDHVTDGQARNNYRASTFWARSMSYLRLKNLEVGYSLPQGVLESLRMVSARFFFQATNLVTFSDFKLWDPEMGSNNGEAYPLTKSFTLGLTVSF
ncbi:MAG: TonB-dependent receptor [Clostridium sp.]|nr:TonB-dependent receptor [Clostridium sp.]